jgi:hypothetical protein
MISFCHFLKKCISLHLKTEFTVFGSSQNRTIFHYYNFFESETKFSLWPNRFLYLSQKRNPVFTQIDFESEKKAVFTRVDFESETRF